MRKRANSFEQGSVLLEVVLALALFVGAATIITAGINASMRSVERVRLQNHAVNLAISVFSEMQMRARAIAPAGPEPFSPPFESWTYKIEIADSISETDAPGGVRPVEVIIKHTQENVVHRLTQMLVPDEVNESTQSVP